MNDRLQTAFAALAGILLVGTAALGGVAGSGSSPVSTVDAQPLAGCEVAQFGPVVVSDVTGLFCNQPNADDLARADAQETKKEIYDQLSVQKQNNELVATSYANYLNDTQSIALMVGKNAYIRALENGSAESIARNQAIQAVADYYSVKQRNLLSQWNLTATVFNSSRTVAENTTNVSASYVTYNGSTQDTGMSYNGLSTKSVTLANATSVDSLSYLFPTSNSYINDFEVAINDGSQYSSYNSGTGMIIASLLGVKVKPPNDNYTPLVIQRFDEAQNRWNQIEAQNDEVQAQLDSFINNTYDSYQQGEISTSDLVDPYLGARQYDPQNSSSWTLRSLTALGVEPPKNLSNVGRMNVSVDGVNYTGVLMSDGIPAGGYAVGGTYNASNITGAQFVALDDGGSKELQGTFTLESVETPDGEQLAENETVEYRQINYQTANTSEFKALQEDLDQLTAEINARQQKIRNSGGGGILPEFGVGGGALPGAVFIGAAVALVVLGRT